MLILFYDLAQCDKWTLTDSLESPKCLSYKESLDTISEESWVTLSDEKAYWADQGFFTLFFHTEICSTNLNEKPFISKESRGFSPSSQINREKAYNLFVTYIKKNEITNRRILFSRGTFCSTLNLWKQDS